MDVSVVTGDTSIIIGLRRIVLAEKPKSLLRVLGEAMRNVVVPQILEFREQNVRQTTCPICGAIEGKDSHAFDVDHAPPTFKELRDKFLAEQDVRAIPFKFRKDEKNLTFFTNNDYAFERRWVEYHRRHANLRKICKKCHEVVTVYAKDDASTKKPEWMQVLLTRTPVFVGLRNSSNSFAFAPYAFRD